MKMDQTLKKHGVNIPVGTVVNGKWHKNHYTIIRKIGEGAVGSVYLCDFNGRRAALKISEQGHSMTVEVNVLKSLQKAQEHRLGPNLLDVDDWTTPQGETYSFYVMEYLRGQKITSFIRNNGSDWIGVFLLQLLDNLTELHKIGWIFGDLKTDNLIVVSTPPKVRFIDVGGTTKVGRAIKEYTEFYDRGYWGLGSRKAEPSYDLFALAIVFLHVFYPNEFPRGNEPKKTLLKRLANVDALRPYELALSKALLGQYQTSMEMKQDITNSLYSRRKSNRKGKNVKRSSSNKKGIFIEGGCIVIVSAIYYISSLLIP